MEMMRGASKLPSAESVSAPSSAFPFACSNCGHKPTPQEVLEHHGDCAKCGDTVIAYTVDSAECIIKGIADTQRLDYLAALLQHCPHAELIFCDEPDADEPLGWTIRIEGCEKSEVTAPTFRECIDKEILDAQSKG